MEFLPKALGTRPRLACEIRSEGAVAAVAEDAHGVLAALGHVALPAGCIVASLRPGNVADADHLADALRRTLEPLAAGARTRDLTLVVPDAAVRVLLLDFDSLPTKSAEALAVVRFRLKKLLPFDVEDAAVSYQVLPGAQGQMQVLAVAMPYDVLAEYEAAVTRAGFVPGAVLPNTLAALCGLEENGAAALVVNVSGAQITTAIVYQGSLLLHRSVEVEAAAEDADQGMADEIAQAVSVAAAYFEDSVQQPPACVWSAGTCSADQLRDLLAARGMTAIPVREMLETQHLAAGAVTAGVARGWLAGVRGALRG
ncbi:MAG: hypothetical protein KGK08_11325 [Acidobacteriota bacterium]|nr:hypothetical protein [Acidobacteriota bacterium]